MNERIQALWEQATSKPHRSQGIGREPTHIYPGTLDPEKFAELIVKECGVALSPMLRDMVSRGQAYDLIKQHFGVEE